MRHLIACHGLQTCNRFFNGRHIADVVLGVGCEMPLEQAGGQHAGICAHLLKVGESCALHDLEWPHR